jgi:hypothetical protein
MAFSPIWSPRGAWLNFSHFLVSHLKLRGRFGISTALQTHCAENSKQIFPEMKLCGLVPNFYINVSVSDLYNPTIGPHILMQKNRWTDRGNI